MALAVASVLEDQINQLATSKVPSRLASLKASLEHQMLTPAL
jgi:hypothetical protein